MTILRKTKRQPSSIDRLEPELQDVLADLKRKGKTVTEIHAALVALGADVSRSAVGRKVKSMAEVGEELRRFEGMARYLVEEFGDEPDERISRANMRMLQGALMQLMIDRPVGEDGEPVQLDVEEAKSISLALQRLVSSQRMDTDRALKLKAEGKREAALEAARKLDAAAKTGEVDPAAVATAKRIMGFD